MTSRYWQLELYVKGKSTTKALFAAKERLRPDIIKYYEESKDINRYTQYIVYAAKPHNLKELISGEKIAKSFIFGYTTKCTTPTPSKDTTPRIGNRPDACTRDMFASLKTGRPARVSRVRIPAPPLMGR